MKKKKHQHWVLSYGAFGGVIGVTIGQLISGGPSWAAVLGGISAAVLFVVIDVIHNLKRKDQTPNFDERTQHNLLKYYAIVANSFIGMALLSLAVITYIGWDQISITYVWVFLVAYMLISGFGGVIVVRK